MTRRAAARAEAPAFRVDGAPADADAFYAIACDPRRSVVVEACAGAGKTWMLVSRMLRALLDGVAPERILAITFTRKAAGEMRARLDQWLQDFAADASSHAERVAALRLRGFTAAEAEARADALGGLRDRLLAHPRGVAVYTFHAWFLQLAAQLPIAMRDALGLPDDPQPIEDTSVLGTELRRRLRRRIAADPALRADHDTLVARHRRSRVDDWIAAAWQRDAELEAAERAGTLLDAVPAVPDAHALLREAPSRALLQALAAHLGARTAASAHTAASGLVDALSALDRGEVAQAFECAWQALFKKDGHPRRQGLGDSPLLADAAALLLATHELRAQQQAHDDHQRLCRLWRALHDTYAAFKRELRVLDMADLERAASALLADGDAVEWMQQRLDLRVQQLLIDEFQDTSPVQWHALFGWLSGYAGAGGGASGQRPPAVFIVGDPKQSIYRFRRAEPRVFEAARRFVVDGLAGHALECDHTRRNAPAVVAALNAVFGAAARDERWGPFRPHSTESVADGAAWALPVVERPTVARGGAAANDWRDSLAVPRHEPEEHLKMTEARRVAEAVDQLVAHQGVPWHEVMVLARRRDMLQRVAAALAERGVPFARPEPIALADEPEALDVAALLDVLSSPGHDLSLARALKSPLFGVDDAALADLADAAAERHRPWLDALVQGTFADPALTRAQTLLAAWRRAAAEATPHELLDRIYAEGDVLERMLAAVPPARRGLALHVLRGVLQAALEHDGGRFVSHYRFVRALRQRRLRLAPPAAPQAVRLLTVHGAKGLEADAVFLVDAAPEPPRPATGTLLVDWPAESAAPRRVAFVATESNVPPSLAALMQTELDERLREEINALYVAASRARRWLVVSHTEPLRTALDWWTRLAPALAPWPALLPVAPAEADARVWVPGLPLLPLPPPGVASVTEDARQRRAAQLGRAVHRVLEWVGQPGAEGLVPTRAQAQAAAAAFGLGAGPGAATPAGADAPEAAGAADEVFARARAVLGSPECQRFFGGAALRWAGNEVPIALDGAVQRIDRLVLLEEGGQRCWWVLDYKLTQRDDALAAHDAQLEGYRQAVAAAAAPGEAVRAAYITGDGRVVERAG